MDACSKCQVESMVKQSPKEARVNQETAWRGQGKGQTMLAWKDH